MNVIIDFTRDCPSRCTTCNIWKNEKGIKPLHVAHIKKFLQQVPNITSVYVTGGEPYFTEQCKHIAHVVKKIHPNAVWCGATNSIHPNTYDRIMYISKLLKVVAEISLDGNPDANDKQRGVPGHHDKAVQLAIKLRDSGIITMFSTLDKTDYVDDLGLRLGIPVTHGQYRAGERYGTDEKDSTRVTIKNCPGGEKYLVLTPLGEVYPCEDYRKELKICDIKSEDITQNKIDKVINYIKAGKCGSCTMTCFDR